MKMPSRAPTINELFDRLPSEQIRDALRLQLGPVDPKGRYLHWDDLRHRNPPNGIGHEAWWLSIKLARQALSRELPLLDENDHPFIFGLPDEALRRLHWIDGNASGQIGMAQPVATSENRDMYLINSLIEEAIRSSQLEGAATTRAAAKRMIREKRRPRDKSEQMIFNNYRAMEYIREVASEPLSPELINELHRVVAQGTLDDPSMAGKYRRNFDDIHVIDPTGTQVLHTPPPADTLRERLERISEFANRDEEESNEFIHPLVKAILLHFAIGYDHPYVDGNGRTARALFYWYTLKTGFWLLEFVSISRVLRQAPIQYNRAYLLTETDSNDTTYFLLHQLGVIETAIRSLHDYLLRKTQELEEADSWLGSSAWKKCLNHRQLALIRHALRHPSTEYSFISHQQTHGCAYQTARTDLLGLADMGLLAKFQRNFGKGFVFRPVPSLRDHLTLQQNN